VHVPSNIPVKNFWSDVRFRKRRQELDSDHARQGLVQSCSALRSARGVLRSELEARRHVEV